MIITMGVSGIGGGEALMLPWPQIVEVTVVMAREWLRMGSILSEESEVKLEAIEFSVETCGCDKAFKTLRFDEETPFWESSRGLERQAIGGNRHGYQGDRAMYRGQISFRLLFDRERVRA